MERLFCSTCFQVRQHRLDPFDDVLGSGVCGGSSSHMVPTSSKYLFLQLWPALSSLFTKQKNFSLVLDLGNRVL